MGAIGTSFAIRRVSDAAVPPAELHRALWDKVAYTIRAMVTGYAGRQVLAQYLSMAADDGYHDGLWTASETELMFVFSDSAGLCSMSSHAALHWLEVVVATESFVHRLVQEAGWELTDIPRVPATKRLLEARGPGFVELGDELYVVSRCGRGTQITNEDLYSDHGIPRLLLVELTPDEWVNVNAATYSGGCVCELCRNTISDVIPWAWQEGRLDDVAATWALLDQTPHDEDTLRAVLTAFSEEQWTEQPLGPPQLQALRASLAAQGLEPPLARLVPMILQRAR